MNSCRSLLKKQNKLLFTKNLSLTPKSFINNKQNILINKKYFSSSFLPNVEKINNYNYNNHPNDNNIVKKFFNNHKLAVTSGKFPDLQTPIHPRIMEEKESEAKFENYAFPHRVWSKEETENIKLTHVKQQNFIDWAAYFTVKILKNGWDLTTGYTFGRQLGLFKYTKNGWMLRIIFLETIAGVPGMMFALVRHLNSLRNMKRDHGWINTLLSEAENERMHLLVSLHLYKPSKIFRYMVIMAQGIYANFLFLMYLISPTYCHRLTGYLEEEAVKTYTIFLKDVDDGKYPEFLQKCDTKIAKGYWGLNDNATWRDVYAQIRADEANHRDVNHTLAPLSTLPNASNPFRNEHLTKNQM